MPHRYRAIVLRGYVKEAGSRRYVGVCLTLNLVVEGGSQDEALCKLRDLIEAYLQDALEHDEFDAFVPRRAPWHFYAEYTLGRAVTAIRSFRHSFLTFKDVRPAHA
jgi:hypothetical protein